MVGLKDAHEGKAAARTASARVKKDRGHVAGAAVEVAQERRGSKEREECTGTTNDRECAVDAVRVRLGVVCNDLRAVRGDAFGTVDQRLELGREVVEPTLVRLARHRPLHGDHALDPVAPLGSHAVEEESMQVDRQNRPSTSDELLR